MIGVFSADSLFLNYNCSFFRCGLRGAYIEVVGFSKEVLAQFKRYLSSPYNAPSTAGQVFQQSYQSKKRRRQRGRVVRRPDLQ